MPMFISVSPVLTDGCMAPIPAPTSAAPGMVAAPGSMEAGASIATLPAKLPILPAVVFYFIFCYIPMYGILIAFTKYYPKKGIWGSLISNFVGFKNFSIIFNNDPEFLKVIRNTLLIGAGKIIISFVAAIVVALLINELRMRRFKKVSQIIVTFTHYLSWVVLAGFITSLFSRTGIIDDIISKPKGK